MRSNSIADRSCGVWASPGVAKACSRTGKLRLSVRTSLASKSTPRDLRREELAAQGGYDTLEGVGHVSHFDVP